LLAKARCSEMGRVIDPMANPGLQSVSGLP